MADTKITKRAIYNGVIETLIDNFEPDDVKVYVDFFQNEIEKLDNRADKEKARRAAKKEEKNELRDKITEVIWEAQAPLTADEIANTVLPDFTDITKAKVVYQVTQLIKDGKAFKQVQKRDDKKVTVYFKEPVVAE